MNRQINLKYTLFKNANIHFIKAASNNTTKTDWFRDAHIVLRIKNSSKLNKLNNQS